MKKFNSIKKQFTILLEKGKQELEEEEEQVSQFVVNLLEKVQSEEEQHFGESSHKLKRLKSSFAFQNCFVLILCFFALCDFYCVIVLLTNFTIQRFEKRKQPSVCFFFNKILFNLII